MTTATVIGLRCDGTRANGRPCHALLAEQVSPPYQIRCARCGTVSNG